MIKLKEVRQNGKKVEIEGIAMKTEFVSFHDLKCYTLYLERVLNDKLTYIIEWLK